MNIIKALLLISTLASVSLAQINISGTVTNTGGTPLQGAAVWLEKFGHSDTTRAGGKFSLTGVGINNHIQLPPKLKVRVSSGILYITATEKGPVEISTFNLQGRVLYKVNKVVEVGPHSIVLPQLGAGVFVHRVTSGRSEFTLKSPSIMPVGSSGSVPVSNPIVTATERRSYGPIDDVIAVTKAVYLNYRVIVTNSDTSGIEIEMIVCADTVTDADGNVYQAVQIGNQVWTVENLRTTKYNDGTAITYIADNDEWRACSTTATAAYCYSNNTTDADSIKKYGALYNGYAVDTKKLAPAGWHVPTDAEWTILEKYLVLNGYNFDGTTDTSSDTAYNKIGKSMAAKTDWETSNDSGNVGFDISSNNRSGFSALPVGYRLQYGGFVGPNIQSPYWSSTESGGNYLCCWILQYDSCRFNRNSGAGKSFGQGVRLLRD